MSAVAEQKRVVNGGAFLIEDRTIAEVFTPEDFTEEHLIPFCSQAIRGAVRIKGPVS